MIKIGLLREIKPPIDNRVALTPQQCQEVTDKFPFVEIVVQRSPFRCFKDAEYESLGFSVKEDVSDCDLLLGIRDVPMEELLHHKTYFFFSQLVKKHPQSRLLLLTLLQRHIRLIDYDRLEDSEGNHLVSFGWWNGRFGVYNALNAYGKKHKLFDLKSIHEHSSWEEALETLKSVRIPPIKIAMTGSGNTSKGAKEVLEKVGFKEISKASFLENPTSTHEFVVLASKDIHYRKDGKPFEREDFKTQPELFECTFKPYTQKADILIVASKSSIKAPHFFSKEDTKSEHFRTKIIADLSADIEGVVPCVKKLSSIKDPFYDYNPTTDNIEPAFSSSKNLTIMAVENLPNELPKNASEGFGRELIDNIFPHLFIEDKFDIITKATITINGKLNKPYLFLQEFADGK
ncbi:MAG: NAD(P)-dependent oxidoreductase [Flammeovirgaceae bacterium]